MSRQRHFSKPRGESRAPMELGVQLSGHQHLPGIETTFTKNVSVRGAQVISSRRWRTNDRALLATLTGSFKTAARVAYCHSVPAGGFAIGLEFVEAPRSQWIIGPAAQAQKRKFLLNESDIRCRRRTGSLRNRSELSLVASQILL